MTFYSGKNYWILKDDIHKNTQDCWLGKEHLELVAQWFMCNKDSPLVDCFDVVQSQFTSTLDKFFTFMMYLN